MKRIRLLFLAILCFCLCAGNALAAQTNLTFYFPVSGSSTRDVEISFLDSPS